MFVHISVWSSVDTIKLGLTLELGKCRHVYMNIHERPHACMIPVFILYACISEIDAWGLIVRGISGGERKRLNIASEVLTLPTVLFTDEPKLDSFMAESIINVLKMMADSGRTIIATVHQPSSKIFELFDDVSLTHFLNLKDNTVTL